MTCLPVFLVCYNLHNRETGEQINWWVMILKIINPSGYHSKKKNKIQLCCLFPLPLWYNKPLTPKLSVKLVWEAQWQMWEFCTVPHFFPSQKSVSNHYQNYDEKPGIPSTQDGAALVVPATCPGKQEHLTVWDLSSILFLLQHRCAAITSQVPAFTWTESTNMHNG